MELLKSAPGAAGQQPQQQQQQAPSKVPDEMRQEIDKMDPYAETITLTYHLRQFAALFLRRVNDDQTLNAVFAHLNEAALADNKFAVKMATVFGSHQLGDVMIQETKIRNAMIGTLQQNFLAIERLKQTDVQRFYNSVTLLGEYYNRKKVLNGRRINILGQSLLLLLTSELEQEITKCTAAQQQQPPHQMDVEFAKLLLEQITLNGAVAKDEHRKEITDLLFTIRKALITVPNLCARSKAFLLMALDLYHSNLAEDLFEKLYNKYLKEPQQQAAEVRTGNGEPVETVKVEPPGESKQSVPKTDDVCIVRVEEKSSPEAAATPKATGIRANSISRGTGGKTTSPQNNHTAHDKENKRRPSSRAGAAPDKKASGPTQTGKRNVRVSDDGKIVATITRDAPSSPTKKTPPSPAPVGGIRAERSQAKTGLSPRMERLAALPKITITCSTPSPKRQGGNSAATSPRAVLGVATAKQQQQQQQPPKHPPKSPIRVAPPKSVPEVHKSPEGNIRSAKVSPSNVRESGDINKPGKAQRGEVSHRENGTNPQKSSPPATNHPIDHAANGAGHTNDKDKALHASNGALKEPPARDNGVSNGTVSNGAMAPGVGQDGTGKVESAQETPAGGATKPKVSSYYREEEEEDVENLSWNAMMALDDDSPQKLNPHTKSFLSFLADK